MDNKKPAATTRKTKKKGRPSLLDLRRRSLRLQQQQHCDLSPDDDPRPAADDDDESDQGRREKKLRLVLRLPNNADAASAGSESDDRRARKIGLVGNDPQEETQNPTSKVTDLPQDCGPDTPLPDKKLLVFILDRLQKKDTYGVFSEPVDPEELPDYHDIIKHPMDFATVRKKVSDDAYSNLEQFEKDVFLICSNAMQYNASDTIYHRQARAIQELAKKNFDNLRQESDDNEQEPKPARRGRPPTRDIFKKIGRPPSGNAGSNLSSNAKLANAGDNRHSVNFSPDLSQKGYHNTNLPTKPYGLRNSEDHSFYEEHLFERNDDTSGSAFKGAALRYPKKSSVNDENRRNTYTEPQVVSSTKPSVLTAFDGQRKQLIPVGLYTEHAYAWSLARFAAKLGPIGWEIAAKRIEGTLPPGTKFSRGWVGAKDAPHPLSQSQPLLASRSPHSSQPENMPSMSASATSEHAVDDTAVEAKARSTPPSFLPSRSLDSSEASSRNQESTSKPHNAIGLHGIWQKVGSQFPQGGSAAMQPHSNGFYTSGFNHLSQAGKSIGASAPPRPSSGIVSRNSDRPSTTNFTSDIMNSAANPSTSSSYGPDVSHGSQETRRAVTMLRPVSFPPDLNAGFQSPGLPVSGVLLDSQNPNPNLALGL
ncbi:uncharacterized protein LOC122030974 [Zingiber officinale]|nr:uncharacterized protein LOC122030974 [Zingiber officinale]